MDAECPQKIELELLNLEYCLLSRFPTTLPDYLLRAHQLMLCSAYKGYVVHFRMLNSLKRFIEELGIEVPSIPTIAFKIFKPIVSQNCRKINKQFQKLILKKHSSKKLSGIDFNLQEYQKKTLKYFQKSNQRIIIGDDWNMGSNYTAAACFILSGYERILIVVPSQLISNWNHTLLQILQKLSKIIQYTYQIRFHDPFHFQQSTKKHIITIISYENLAILQLQQLNHIKINYNGLIIDQPFYLRNIKNQFNKVNALNILKQVSIRISGLIIVEEIKQLADTRILMPLINNKLKEDEVMQRYKQYHQSEKNLKPFKHFVEYRNALLTHYYVKNSKKQYKSPTIVQEIWINNISQPMNNRQQLTTRLTEINFSECDLKNAQFHNKIYQQLGIFKASTIISYFKYLLRYNNQIHNFYAIYTQQSTATKLYNQICIQISDANIFYSKNKNYKGKQFQNIKICKIVDAVQQLQTMKKASGCQIWDNSQNNIMTVFCELYRNQQQQLAQQYAYKMFLLCEKIQYLILTKDSHKNSKLNQQDPIKYIYELQHSLFRPQITIDSMQQNYLHEQNYNYNEVFNVQDEQTENKIQIQEQIDKEEVNKCINSVNLQKQVQNIQQQDCCQSKKVDHSIISIRSQNSKIGKIQETNSIKTNFVNQIIDITDNSNSFHTFNINRPKNENRSISSKRSSLSSRSKRKVEKLITIKLKPRISRLQNKE